MEGAIEGPNEKKLKITLCKALLEGKVREVKINLSRKSGERHS